MRYYSLSIDQPRGRITLLLNIFVALVSCTRPPNFDVVLRNGLICDGTGSTCTAGGVAITGDKIAKRAMFPPITKRERSW
jgi:hypothetical protein